MHSFVFPLFIIKKQIRFFFNFLDSFAFRFWSRFFFNSSSSHDQIKFKGVSNQNVGKFLERVPREEIALVEALCGHIMEFFDYEKITSTSEQARALEKFYAFYNQRYFFYDKYQ